MIRVLIADDHPMVRKGLAELVAEAGDMQPVGEADGYATLARVLREQEADVLLLDVDMPGRNGIEILKTVRISHPRLHVLVFSMYPEDQYAVRALRAGAAGYINKSTSPQTVLEAIREASRGRKYVTPVVARLLADQIGQDSSGSGLRHEQLSDREFQTLRLIASGRKLADIAGELLLSPKTVSVYRARLLKKMMLKSNAELTRYAIEHRLVD